MAIIPRYVVRFRDLRVGDHFKFVGSSSFFSPAKKVSSRCYVWAGKKGVTIPRGRGWHTNVFRAGLLKTCVGSVNVKVEPTGRRSPMKFRRGRHRGGRTFAGHRRRR